MTESISNQMQNDSSIDGDSSFTNSPRKQIRSGDPQAPLFFPGEPHSPLNYYVREHKELGTPLSTKRQRGKVSRLLSLS